MENEPRAKRRANEVGPSGRRAAANLESIREQRRLSQDELAALTGRLGRPMTRQIVSKTEVGDRRIDADDLVAFAVALGVTPNRLLLPGHAGAEIVELLPEVHVSAMDAWKWATGDEPLPAEYGPADRRVLIRDDRERLFIRENQPHNVPEPYFHNVGHDVREHRDLVRMVAAVVIAAKERGVPLGRLTRMVEEIDRWRLFGTLDEAMAKLSEDNHTRPQEQPVVAAIVTSVRGVLIGRRNDGKPPWTFIAGEVEPGERPEDAAVREVKEETGCLVRAAQMIGERVHPKTGRTMIYMAALPTHGTDVFVGDSDELAEVRWVGLAEADELLPGMFPPVREYLAATIGHEGDG